MEQNIKELLESKKQEDIDFLTRTKDDHCTGSIETQLHQIRRELKHLSLLLTLTFNQP